MLNGTAVNGIIGHLVPMLTDRGVSMWVSAGALSTVAAGQVAGRVLSGLLLDRVPSPRVGILWFASVFAGIAVLALLRGVAAIYVGAALCGLGLGADLELGNYIVSRLFGLKNFGQIFGVVYACFVVGVSGGAYLMGLCFDLTGGYAACIAAFEVMLVIGMVLMALLEPYRYPASGDPPPPQSDEEACSPTIA
jgi:MFS family permease